MKKFLLLVMFLFGFVNIANAQMSGDTLYVSHNGSKFKVGAKINLGLGARENGDFKYINSFSVYGVPNDDSNLPSQYAARQVTIIKIKKVKSNFLMKSSPTTIYILFESDLGVRYGINIEPALLAKEVQ